MDSSRNSHGLVQWHGTTIIGVTYVLTDIAYALADPRITFVKDK